MIKTYNEQIDVDEEDYDFEFKINQIISEKNINEDSIITINTNVQKNQADAYYEYFINIQIIYKENTNEKKSKF